MVDVADKAAWPYRGRRYAVRVTPAVPHWNRLSAAMASTDEPALDDLLDALPAETDDEDLPECSVRKQLTALRRARGRIEFHFPYGPPDQGAIVVACYGLDGATGKDQPVTGDDSLSHSAGRPVSLYEHTDAGS